MRIPSGVASPATVTGSVSDPALPAETLVVDYVGTMLSTSVMALACALVVALVLAGGVVARSKMSRGHRWGLVAAWSAMSAVAALTAAPIARWDLPAIAVLSLPTLVLLAPLARGPLDRALATLGVAATSHRTES